MHAPREIWASYFYAYTGIHNSYEGKVTAVKVVQPIRDLEALDRCFEIARAHDAKRRYKNSPSWELLLLVGFNTSLRISDIAPNRVEELRGQEYIRRTAKKTGKDTRILINPATRREINRLTKDMDGKAYLFQSRQKDKYGRAKPIERQRAYQIINEIARAAGIKERIGCHTLRKTFGYHYYRMTGDVVSLQRILGHDSQRDTLVYIGITDDAIDESLKKFRLIGGKR